ncbi:MAG TPA: 16S rRNA (uracil(1498)-N(3))-methyltransferase [Geminicoccaceae bacterium]|nr:16S rRNA (uracil(1498)-N(3))-methyltransferase [Geminicoccaceae bacterium]
MISTARPRIRLYVDLSLGPEVVLEPSSAQCHHLLIVMRQRAGDPIALFNGRDGEWLANVEAVQRRHCRLAVRQLLRRQEPEPGPALLFGPLRRTRQEFLVEKATELGAASLEPVVTQRSIADRVNLARLASIAIEAAEQCGRITVPALAPVRPLAERLKGWPAGRRLYHADETGGGLPIAGALRTHGPGDLLVGPAGGFDPAEIAALQACAAVVPISLGPRTLRAETAALAALACWQALCGPALAAGAEGQPAAAR